MRSRIAITALLATGALMSSGGAALGVSALSTTGDASQAQYGPVQTVTPRSDVLAETAEGSKPKSGTKAERAASTPAAKAQPARQLEASSDDELPFTGYAAIPLLFAGLALLVFGLVLRRGTRPSARQLT